MFLKDFFSLPFHHFVFSLISTAMERWKYFAHHFDNYYHYLLLSCSTKTTTTKKLSVTNLHCCIVCTANSQNSAHKINWKQKGARGRESSDFDQKFKTENIHKCNKNDKQNQRNSNRRASIFCSKTEWLNSSLFFGWISVECCVWAFTEIRYCIRYLMRVCHRRMRGSWLSTWMEETWKNWKLFSREKKNGCRLMMMIWCHFNSNTHAHISQYVI